MINIRTNVPNKVSELVFGSISGGWIMTAANTGRTVYMKSGMRRKVREKAGYRGRSSRPRKRNSRRERIVSFLAGALFATVVLVIMFLLSAGTASAENIKPERVYRSVRIEAGDTLWDIAEREMDSAWSAKHDYIKEVERINNICSDNISAGDYLILPYSR